MAEVLFTHAWFLSSIFSSLSASWELCMCCVYSVVWLLTDGTTTHRASWIKFIYSIWMVIWEIYCYDCQRNQSIAQTIADVTYCYCIEFRIQQQTIIVHSWQIYSLYGRDKLKMWTTNTAYRKIIITCYSLLSINAHVHTQNTHEYICIYKHIFNFYRIHRPYHHFELSSQI